MSSLCLALKKKIFARCTLAVLSGDTSLLSPLGDAPSSFYVQENVYTHLTGGAAGALSALPSPLAPSFSTVASSLPNEGAEAISFFSTSTSDSSCMTNRSVTPFSSSSSFLASSSLMQGRQDTHATQRVATPLSPEGSVIPLSVFLRCCMEGKNTPPAFRMNREESFAFLNALVHAGSICCYHRGKEAVACSFLPSWDGAPSIRRRHPFLDPSHGLTPPQDGKAISSYATASLNEQRNRVKSTTSARRSPKEEENSEWEVEMEKDVFLFLKPECLLFAVQETILHRIGPLSPLPVRRGRRPCRIGSVRSDHGTSSTVTPVTPLPPSGAAELRRGREPRNKRWRRKAAVVQQQFSWQETSYWRAARLGRDGLKGGGGAEGWWVGWDHRHSSTPTAAPSCLSRRTRSEKPSFPHRGQDGREASQPWPALHSPLPLVSSSYQIDFSKEFQTLRARRQKDWSLFSLALSLELLLLGYGTFIAYGWDVMEPICYFLTNAISLGIMGATILRTQPFAPFRTPNQCSSSTALASASCSSSDIQNNSTCVTIREGRENEAFDSVKKRIAEEEILLELSAEEELDAWRSVQEDKKERAASKGIFFRMNRWSPRRWWRGGGTKREGRGGRHDGGGREDTLHGPNTAVATPMPHATSTNQAAAEVDPYPSSFLQKKCSLLPHLWRERAIFATTLGTPSPIVVSLRYRVQSFRGSTFRVRDRCRSTDCALHDPSLERRKKVKGK